ncbi:MAG: acyl-ACP--UDP-N-acetylglucosamine O-acyltransferase [Deltaproteobacteria bacterium]|nr:acyl-ACP--UDP-N-acetylglucosamine O-acyltransferase [Deltaproteobacteria bacterium]
MRIHQSAHIHPEANIADSVEIGPWCTVGAHAKIGAGTKLLSHVVIDGWTEIGENNTIFPFVVIGAIPQDLKYKGEPTRVVIGNSNTIRESVTINLGTVQGGGVTSVGNNSLLMAYTHLGHDCRIGNNCIIANYGGLAGHVILQDYATLTGMIGVSQFVRVGTHAYIGGQSGLERDVPPFSVAVGSRPTSLKGANIVGLRRRGFTTEKIQKINEAIKLWTRSDVQKEQCLLEIESQYGEVPEIQQFITFIRESEIGVVR